MAKNPRLARPASPSSPAPALTPLSKKLLSAGVVCLIAGFWVLTLTDPAGQNWASLLSPFLILAGYGLFGAGLFITG